MTEPYAISDEDEGSDGTQSVSEGDRVKNRLFTQVAGPEFHPNYIMSEWDDPTSTSKKISIAIWLPSGVLPESYKFQVSTCGFFLHLNAPLPIVMTDTKLLHKFWLSKPENRGGIKGYHPKISGFEHFLKKHRTRKSASIVTVGNLELPARVDTHMDENLQCTWVDHAEKVLYLTLKCASDGYADGAEGNSGIMTAEAPGDGSSSGILRM